MLDIQDLNLLPHHHAFVDRFVNACQADDRIVAAFLDGSYAKGYADEYSDVDLCVITKDEAYEEFFNQRKSFLHLLGELVFLEDFGIPNIAFYIFADGVEGELNFGSESHLERIHSGPFRILIDKRNILTGVVFAESIPAPSEQTEKLRGQIYGFWHEMSHFVTAMGRDQLWWAHGQLESLRSICVNLARLKHNFLDGEIGEEPYFKIEKAMPVQELAALKTTFCLLEKNAMLDSAQVIVQFYVEIAPPLAQTYGIRYPLELEMVMIKQLEKLLP